MAKANAKAFRELGDDALAGKVKELEADLFNLRFQLSMGKLENTAKIRSARREVALAKTLLKQNANKAKA